jgi:hypothetical protein
VCDAAGAKWRKKNILGSWEPTATTDRAVTTDASTTCRRSMSSSQTTPASSIRTSVPIIESAGWPGPGHSSRRSFSLAAGVDTGCPGQFSWPSWCSSAWLPACWRSSGPIRCIEHGGLLPATELLVGGLSKNSRELRPGVLALIPPSCECVPLLDDLFRQVKEYGYPMYLVGSEAMRTEIQKTARDVGNGTAAPVVDPSGTLTATYAARGVTVLLVHADGIVGAVFRELAPGVRLEPELAPLSSPGHTSLAPNGSSSGSGG